MSSSPPASNTPLALWGGIECTVVRIGERYRNQIAETGHDQRQTDLDAIAGLGIRTLRYPVLWETIAPDHPDRCEWGWHDARLTHLQQLGITPIAGLMHHGSGPRYTDLTDVRLPEMLAKHAERVAERYPWLRYFTPVNEPLTTARFSGLYGHWYPHGTDISIFLRTLVTQCRAIVLSMQAIRRLIPDAQLVQTEDLGKVFSTPPMRYQAEYENERRWLSFDLLCGRIDRHHPWYGTFIDAGIGEDELAFFMENPCPPDILGVNHYLTSERFLDHRVKRYPIYHRANNQRHRYADVEAVRIDLPPGTTGPKARLLEAWQRYRLPMAVTEAHHGGARDEQLRWLIEVWQAAQAVREEGIDLRAVTVWSLLGCVDWNSLLMEQHGFYESGAFDVRCNPPHPTAIAAAAKSLATTGSFEHPVLETPGWWHRGDRLYQPVSRIVVPRPNAQHLGITGATGTLGHAFSRIGAVRGLHRLLFTRGDMDITDRNSVEAALDQYQPWAVINTAGYVRVAEAEQDAERCFRENAEGAEILAQACARRAIPYVVFSSDLVFDGQLGRPYVESDPVSPASVYGASKAEAERRVLSAYPQSLIIRTSAFFGPWDHYNFLHIALSRLEKGEAFEASDSVFISPTYVPDLANAVLDLLIDNASGIWHLANQGSISWYELAAWAAREAGVSTDQLVKRNGDARMTTLSSERGLLLPPLEKALKRFVNERTNPHRG